LSTVFIGTSDFAAAVLERLALSESNRPALVVTRPDRPSGRGRRLTSPPVADRARELGIALEQPHSVNDTEVSASIAAALDRDERGGSRQRVVVCAFGALIKEPLLSEHELLNVHPSLLPRWRGAAPVERAIMAGDTKTGVSIMRLTAGLDSGPVCLTGEEPINSDDSYGSLAERLQWLAGELLVRALDEDLPFSDQPQEGVTYAEKLSPEDRLLDPSLPAVQLERTVRALHPHIGARVALADGSLLGVQRAALVDMDDPAVEQVPAALSAAARRLGPYEHDGRLLLACESGVLEMLVVQPPGGRPMEAAAYLRGHGLPGRA
jgi:methionyl-tRNA formyltransferase